jgi:class 3 adenylate cyclase
VAAGLRVLGVLAEPCGSIFKTTGNGLLAQFGSAVDAVRYAVEVQTVMASRSVSEPQTARIEFRIGVNIGDIVEQDGDIFRDGVNAAARLEGIADPGGICVSARVRDDVAGRVDLAFDDMGEQKLKNIASRSTLIGYGSQIHRRPRRAQFLARQAVDCRHAVPKHERRPRAGVFW